MATKVKQSVVKCPRCKSLILPGQKCLWCQLAGVSSKHAYPVDTSK